MATLNTIRFIRFICFGFNSTEAELFATCYVVVNFLQPSVLLSA